MYEVMNGDDVTEFKTRAEAIAEAKRLSAENARGSVQVTDEQRREKMSYQAGELVSYDYETRRS